MIADNGSSDERQTALLARLEQAGFIRRLELRAFTMQPQFPAYIAMYDLARCEGVSYIGFIDADEFFEPLSAEIEPDSGRRLVVEAFKTSEKTLVGYNWMCFGSGGESGKDLSIPVMRRFNFAAPQDCDYNRHIKSFMDVDKVARLSDDAIVEKYHPHGLQLNDEFYSHDGIAGDRLFYGQFGMTHEVRWNTARIRHYIIKSKFEFETKRRRGRADTVDKSHEENYFSARDRNEVYAPLCPSASAALEDEIAKIKEKLALTTQTTVPDVDPVSIAAGRFYAQRIKELIAKELNAIVHERDTIKRRRFQDLLKEIRRATRNTRRTIFPWLRNRGKNMVVAVADTSNQE
jgi:hypothetical protein